VVFSRLTARLEAAPFQNQPSMSERATETQSRLDWRIYNCFPLGFQLLLDRAGHFR
jgi:hypothetical protein